MVEYSKLLAPAGLRPWLPVDARVGVIQPETALAAYASDASNSASPSKFKKEIRMDKMEIGAGLPALTF